MNLLITTQKVDINDDVLGFMHGWVEEFAKYCEKVIVICLQQGEHKLPKNVKVLSLGKELRIKNYELRITNFFNKAIYIFKFYKYIWREKRNYDKVFVHMNPEYIVLGGLFWRMFGKKIVLWYAHGHTPRSLKIAEKLTDIIFTSTKSGCRLKSKKIKVVGQGVDVNKLKAESYKVESQEEKFKIITVGRISPVKDYETLIKAVELLCSNKLFFRLQVDIIGGAGLPDQKKYLNKLKKAVKDKKLDNVVNFVGAVPNKDIARYLKSADIFVNMSHTGSLDKAILEAMACGLPVLTCNEALKDVLSKYKEALMYIKGDYKELAKKIKLLLYAKKKEREKIGRDLRDIVIKEHSLERLIKKIIALY